MNSNKITSLATGVSGTDAANVDNITTYKWCYSVPVFNDGTGTNKDRTYIITGAPFEIGGAMINVPLVDSGIDFTLTFVVPAISGSHANSSTNGAVHVYSISPGGVGHGWRLTWDRLTTTSISLRVSATGSNATITTRAANATLFRRD
jgi:hypothetical protein